MKTNLFLTSLLLSLLFFYSCSKEYDAVSSTSKGAINSASLQNSQISFASTNLVADLDFENSTIAPTTWNLTDLGQTYTTALEGHNLVQPALSTTSPRMGATDLLFDSPAQTSADSVGGYPKYRTEYWLETSATPTTGIKMGETVYIGYSLFIDPVTGNLTSTDWACLSQFQQYGEWPTLSLHILPGTSNTVYFQGYCGQNTANLLNAGYYQTVLTKGIYYDIILKFSPSPTSSGSWGLWIKESTASSYTYAYSYTGALGFTATGDPQGRINFNSRVGLYRSTVSPRVKVRFDNVRLGTYWSSVDPSISR